VSGNADRWPAELKLTVKANLRAGQGVTGWLQGVMRAAITVLRG